MLETSALLALLATGLDLAVAALLGVLACTLVLARSAIDRRFRHPRRLRTAGVVAALACGLPLAGFALMPALVDAHRWVHHLVLLLALIAVGTTAAWLATQRLARPPARLPRRILAVGAHPDDLELACGATLAKLADAGHEVATVTMSHGGHGGEAATRRREALLAADLMGAAHVSVLDLPDTRLGEHEAEMMAAVEALINDFAPDLVFTHSAHDQHQDHQAVHRAVLRAARRHTSILCFESPSVTRSFTPTVYVDVEDYVDVKVAAVAAHRDQRSKPYMSADRLQATAVFRGAEARVRHAEGFEPVRLLGSSAGAL